MGKYSNLGKNTILVFVGSLGSKVLTILMLPFYTAWLSVNDFGNVDLISTYTSLIMSVVTLCMTDAIFRFPKDKTKEEQIEYFTSGLTLVLICLFVTGLLYFLLLKIDMSVTWGVFKNYATYIYVLLLLNFWWYYFFERTRSITDKITAPQKARPAIGIIIEKARHRVASLSAKITNRIKTRIPIAKMPPCS